MSWIVGDKEVEYCEEEVEVAPTGLALREVHDRIDSCFGFVKKKKKHKDALASLIPVY